MNEECMCLLSPDYNLAKCHFVSSTILLMSFKAFDLISQCDSQIFNLNCNLFACVNNATINFSFNIKFQMENVNDVRNETSRGSL